MQFKLLETTSLPVPFSSERLFFLLNSRAQTFETPSASNELSFKRSMCWDLDYLWLLTEQLTIALRVLHVHKNNASQTGF